MQPNNEVDTGSTLTVELGTLPSGQQLQTDADIQHSQQQTSQQPLLSKSLTATYNQIQQNDQQTLKISTDELQSIQQAQIPDNTNILQPPPIQHILPLLAASTPNNNKKSTKQTQQNNSQNTLQGQQMPVFYNLLNDADKEAYNKMRITLSSPACKHRRHHSKELNREIVNTIKSFVVRNDPEDWKRALVTGIAWLPNAIAINTRQLRLLLSKCKSSINALFQNLGYYTIPTTNDYSSSIISCFPLLKDNFAELRKWTIRLVSPPDGKSPLHQQQKMAFQQQHQNIQPPQITQPQQVKNELSVDIRPNQLSSSITSNVNESSVVDQQQQQLQNNAPNSILAPKCPVEINNQSS